MTAASLIARMFTHKITVTRRTVGVYSTDELTMGEYMPGTPTVISNVLAVVYPSQGEDLLRLSESDRTKESFKIITAEPLLTSDEITKAQADIVTFEDKDFEVINVMRWKGLGFIAAWECTVVRLSR